MSHQPGSDSTFVTFHTRVVITGIGWITPLGSSIEDVWQALLAGKSGIRHITQFNAKSFPCQIAGEIPNFNPNAYLPAKQARRMSRASQIALVSASMAAEDAQLDLPLSDPERVAISFGTTMGGYDRADEGTQQLRRKGVARVNPFYLPSAIPNMPAFHIAHQFGVLGPNYTITTACASGTQAIGQALDLIRNNRADIVFAGGTEALIKDFTIGGFCAMSALPTSYNDAPQSASRPFDAKREGFVFSEGAACLILERATHALERGASIYAELLGHAVSADAFHIAAPDPEAEGAARAMRWALTDAGIAPSEIQYINAHGTSTPANDAAETQAIKKVFKEAAYHIPISSTKSMLGHPMGASGAIEAAACALTIHHGIIHPTINYEFPDPACNLDYVTEGPRDFHPKHVLSNSFGLGGQNSCLVLKRWEAPCNPIVENK